MKSTFQANETTFIGIYTNDPSTVILRSFFVFQNETVLNNFVNSGWTFGGQMTAAAKYEKNGDAYQDATIVSDGILMYQLTDSGLAAEVTGKGTKYYKDSTLN